MGIFSKKPSGSQQAYIASAISEVQIQYKNVATTSNIENFLESYRKTKDSMKYLLDAERKFPSYFRHPKPSENMKKIESERLEMEHQLIDRLIVSIEKRLLDFSTDRGKRNNFNKEVDKFRYYAGEFLPETVNYFENIVKERFPEYI